MMEKNLKKEYIYIFVSAFSHFSGLIYSLELGQGQRKPKFFYRPEAGDMGVCVCVCVCMNVTCICLSVPRKPLQPPA